jgi:catechol 2,3-dioxygenase-like lactoylglutathione lyase family enzyme
MSLKVNAILLGVADIARSRKFYSDALGCKVDKDYPNFVSLELGDGSPAIALYEREAAAQDAGVSSEGSGFAGVSFHYFVDTNDAVDDVIQSAAEAGGSVVRSASGSEWGGYFGYFGDPDGFLWKVIAASS